MWIKSEQEFQNGASVGHEIKWQTDIQYASTFLVEVETLQQQGVNVKINWGTFCFKSPVD